MQIIHKQTDLPLETPSTAASSSDVVETQVPTNTAANDSAQEDVNPALAIIKNEETEKKQLDLGALLFGANSEVTNDIESCEKQFCVALAKDGLYEKRNNPIGSFIFHKFKFDVPYSHNLKPITPSFKFKMDKIPGGFLDATVKLFRGIMLKMGNSESMIQIFWDTEKKEFFHYVPEQYVSGVSIKFVHNEAYQSDSRYVWVIDIHSHNTMSAFFSGGDDRDEKSTRIFGVLGQLNKEDFAHKFRAGCNGRYYDLKLEDIFDLENKTEVKIDDEDIKKVKPLSEMPESLRSCVVAVGGENPVKTVTATNTAPTNYSGRTQSDPSWRYNGGGSSYHPFKDDDDSTSYMSGRGLRQVQRRAYRDSQPVNAGNWHPGSSGHRVVRGSGGNNSSSVNSSNNFIAGLDCSAKNISYEAWIAVNRLAASINKRFNAGPTIYAEDMKDDTFSYPSEILFEIFDVVMWHIGEEIGGDSSEVNFEEDLTDLSIGFVSLLSRTKSFQKCLTAMATEIEAIKAKENK